MPHRDLEFIGRFARFLAARDIDILHTHSSKAGILGRMAGWIAGTPVIIHTIHGWGFNDFQSLPVRRFYVNLEKLAALRSDLLIAVSHENVERGLREGIGQRLQYRVIRSGIDTSQFTHCAHGRGEMRRSLGIRLSAPVVITVGNFKPQKAPLDFVRAAAIVGVRMRRAIFIMVGDGEMRPAAQKLAEKLGLKSRVIFTGWRRDVSDLLHASDVFALSSLFEGLPRSVLQAQAAGLPVVATRAGGTPEAVKEGVSGHLVERGDWRRLAERIIGLLKDRKKAIQQGRAGQEAMGAEFDIRNMLRDIERAYIEIAERKIIL